MKFTASKPVWVVDGVSEWFLLRVDHSGCVLQMGLVSSTYSEWTKVGYRWGW